MCPTRVLTEQFVQGLADGLDESICARSKDEFLYFPSAQVFGEPNIQCFHLVGSTRDGLLHDVSEDHVQLVQNLLLLVVQLSLRFLF